MEAKYEDEKRRCLAEIENLRKVRAGVGDGFIRDEEWCVQRVPLTL